MKSIRNPIEKYLNNTDNNENNGLYEWDSLSFLREPYYDYWAYSAGRFQLGCWTYPQIPIEKAKEHNVYTVELYQQEMAKYMKDTINAEDNKGKMVEVDSAFCGFALYKKKVFEGCFYKGVLDLTYMNKKMLEENLRLYRLHRKIEDFVGMPDCEHRYFHMMAKRKNNARIIVACEPVFTQFG